MEAEDAKGSWFGGVEVELRLFEWGRLFDGKVFWEAFDREAGEIIGHLIGLLGFFWRVFIHARRVADCVTRQVAVYRVSVTRQFIWISGILEMGYLQGFVLSFWGSWRWDISRDSTKTCMHLRSAIRGQGPMTPTVTLWVWQVDYRGSEARY